MKKCSIILLSIIILFLSFIKSWYSDQLFDLLYVFYIIPNIILFLLFNFCLINGIKQIRKEHYIDYVSLIVLLIAVLLFVFFPFRKCKVKYELEKLEEDRMIVIEKIKKNEIVQSDDNDMIKLTGELKKCSTGGDISIYQNDEEGQVIVFWIYRGILNNSFQLIYSTGGKELIRKNETGHPITKIERLKENWFYVETDY